MNSKNIGETAQAVVLSKLIQNGKSVSIPFGDNQRYDLIVDDAGTLLKVQVKSAVYRYGCIRFKTCSIQTHKDVKQRISYKGQIDYFAAYCPELNTVYWIKVEDVEEDTAILRVDPPKNNQTKGIRWARDYLI